MITGPAWFVFTINQSPLILHWAFAALLLTTGVGLYQVKKWARVTIGCLAVPLALICLDMFLMFGVTRSGHDYFLACLPFLIVFLGLLYTAVVLLAVRPEKAQKG
jgi:predicted permease